MGGVGQMIMFYAKNIWFTNKVWLQGGLVGGVQKGQNIDYVIFEWSLIGFRLISSTEIFTRLDSTGCQS